jgi:hypothetical protein
MIQLFWFEAKSVATNAAHEEERQNADGGGTR